jgi:ribosomal protein S2
MSKYYNRLIKKTKLLNFWTFSGIKLKNIFLLNYGFLFCFYKKNVFFEYTNCISIVKTIFPILHSIIDNNAKILFAGTKYFYTQSFLSVKSKFVSKLTEVKMGSFTNFVIEGFKFFHKTLKKNSSLIFFFNLSKNDFLLTESKKKKIPSIGLLNANNNCSLVDYPIFFNSFYFHNVYFFSRLIFKYILRLF